MDLFELAQRLAAGVQERLVPCLPPFELCAPLQAGGAFGAYPAGVYEALAEAIRHPNWIACTSIGAVDGALIAGNAND